MKKILVPTDFSENAWNALCYALYLFREEECTFYLLNTYTPAISNSRFMAASMENGILTNTAHQCSNKGLETLLEKVEQQLPNPKHRFETLSSFSLLVDEVVSSISTYGIDLVVTGTKGASGMEEVFMGSNTVRIIKAVKECPVLAIPAGFDYVKPSEIAFATDFNRFYTKSELAPMLELAKSFRSVIRIVHVQYEIKALTEMQQFNLDMLRKYLKEVEHYVHTVSEVTSVSKTLELFSEELDIHLLAMLNYQHSYVERLTREPIVKRMAFHTKNPLLVIPELGMKLSNKSRMGESSVTAMG
ncbi:universal stress protein [Maribacter sp. 2307ULW6-5]|uniref:universal stress protein n=1 Tax=Maribacter sp. 2307ULW6-5 TaxID=3386275 RepID=UPI0039BCA2AC